MYAFEPSNSNLLSQKMFVVGDVRIPNKKRRIVRRKLIEKKLKMTGEEQKEFEGETNYPVSADKKIFILGMTPKTLLVSLGVIVISIWIIKQTGGSPEGTHISSGV